MFAQVPQVPQVLVAPSVLMKIADATTIFGANLSVGTQIYDIANDKSYAVKTKIIYTETITTAAASLSLINTAAYSSVTASSIISTTSTTDVVAAGMTLTPGAGSYIVTLDSQYAIAGSNQTGQSVTGLTAVYNTLMGVAATNTTHGAAFENETLSPGVYTIAAAGSAAGTLTLNGGPTDIFIFRFGAAFSLGAATTINLTGGASACNVFWVAEGAIGVGALSTLRGTFISNSGAIGLGASCNVTGRLLTRAGAINIDGSTVAVPIGCSDYPGLGVLSGFGLFSTFGNLTSTGGSTINGNIGTNSGTITGFGGIVNGAIYLPGVDNNALATFSIYQNGVLIANSSRTRTLNVNTVDVSLRAIATVADGQAIDIRWRVDSGTITFTNRILTLNRVRL